MKKNFSKFLFCIISLAVTCVFASPDNHALFENKNIVVLGGTGFLGRAITEKLLQYNPASITIFSRDEVKHFNMSKLFGNNPKIKFIIGDIRDYQDVLYATKHADVVFHVAALKRIDILESNVEQSIKTNILGSINVFNACVENSVNRLVFISTDKACSPINIYGACKFASEKIFTNYDPSKITTKFVVARYGNVLESTGSAIPIFTEKIKNGDDIPLTDERMTRFMITKDEAVALIFDALRYGIGGEIFVTRMPAHKVTDLIEILKEAFHGNNTIKLIGLRPGEKLHEALISQAEMARTYEFAGRFIIRPSVINLYYKHQTPPIYIREGKPVDVHILPEYSSDMAVVSKDEVAKLFLQWGVLEDYKK